MPAIAPALPRWVPASEVAPPPVPHYSAHLDGEECCEVDEVFGDCYGECGCAECRPS